LGEANVLRHKLRVKGKSLMPTPPKGRVFGTPVANFKEAAGNLHFAHAAALDG
jgi:hypothetical protein